MIKVLFLFIMLSAAAYPLAAQKIIRATPQPMAPPAPKPAEPEFVPRVVVQEPPAVPSKVMVGEPAEVDGNTYRNRLHGFEIVFPDAWTITGDDFGEFVHTRGIDLSLKAPDELSQINKIQLDRSLKNVTVLLTAFRSAGGSANTAILRISTEDLSGLPQVKDAVDYFDLMRSQFQTMKLATDFKYSDTQAEKLGKKQFAFLDTSTAAGKKRLYATVKNRRAVMFALSYKTEDDLRTMQQILAAGNFYYK